MEIETISDYLKFCQEKCTIGSLYRGVVDENYRLIPSIGRVSSTVPYDQVIGRETNMLRIFRTDSQAYISNYDLPDLELLAIAQHHGLKTRLLDWTRSALVALFFACEKDYDNNGAIYVLTDTKGIGFIDGIKTREVKPFEMQEDMFFMPHAFTNRITAQQGMLLLFKNPLAEFSHESLTKLVVPANQKRKIRYDLQVLGITKVSLFPNLDGLSSFLNYTFAYE